MKKAEMLFTTTVLATAFGLALGLMGASNQSYACHRGTAHGSQTCDGGGGGSGSGDSGTLAACDVFDDSGTDIVESDGGGVYCHKLDGNINVGERHRLDTNKLNPNDRVGDITADNSHCTAGPEDFTAVGENLDITLQIRGKQTCVSDISDGGTCNCIDFSGCSADNFDSGSTPAILREMAGGDVAWRALTLQFTPSGRHLVTLAYNAEDESIFNCYEGMPAKVTCMNTADGFCNEWDIEGKEACFLEAPRRSANPTFRTLCSGADFLVTVTLKP